jgi:hypothetical protein
MTTAAQMVLMTQDPLTRGVAMSFLTSNIWWTQVPVIPGPMYRVHFNREAATPTGVGTVSIGGTLSSTANTVLAVTKNYGRVGGRVDIDTVNGVYDPENIVFQIQSKMKALYNNMTSNMVGSRANGSFNIEGLQSLASLSTGSDLTILATTGSLGAALTIALLDRLVSVPKKCDWISLNRKKILQYKNAIRAMGFGPPQLIPVGYPSPSGQVVQNILAYEGIPMFRNDDITTESTYSKATGGTNKYRIYAGAWAQPGEITNLSVDRLSAMSPVGQGLALVVPAGGKLVHLTGPSELENKLGIQYKIYTVLQQILFSQLQMAQIVNLDNNVT